MNNENFHIGREIERVLDERRMMKCVLAQKLGVSESTAIHLTKRRRIDVVLLQKIGNVLGYNFFQHYPVGDGKTEVADLREAVAVRDARIAVLEREIVELKAMELNFLRLSNEQYRESQRMLAASLRVGAGQKVKVGKRELFG